jgi:hypothetical protein
MDLHIIRNGFTLGEMILYAGHHQKWLMLANGVDL